MFRAWVRLLGLGFRVGFRVWGKGVQDFALPVQGFGMPRYANLP